MEQIKSLLGDGSGNLSLMRLVILLVVLAIIASKFYNGWLTKQPIEWTGSDLTLLATVIGGKLIQNTQER